MTDTLRKAASNLEGVSFYGPSDPCGRLAHLICLGIEGVEAQGVVLGLDQAGVAAHSGSACSSEEIEPSQVLAAMGVSATNSLRLSVGWSTTEEEISLATESLPKVVTRLRSLATRYAK